jgi:multidrug efflux pump subunit AcrA (membrane-fusion protein)
MATHQKQDKLIAWSSIVAVAVITIIIVGFIFPGAGEGTVGNGVEEPDRMVSVIQFEPGAIVSEIEITGRVTAADRIELFSEVQGRFDNGSSPFRTGIRFSEGDTLARIDDTEERLALISQRSRFLTTLSGVLSTQKLDYPDLYETWAEYTDTFDPVTLTQELPIVENRQARLFLTSRGINEQFYTIRSAEARLKKFTIVAPFDGELQEANLDPGSLVQPGVRLGEFTGRQFELESYVSLQDFPFIEIGDPVALNSPALNQNWSGSIVRIGSGVDSNTQSLPVFVGLSGGSMRDGIYLEGIISGRTLENAVEIPRNLLTREHTILVVENGRATHKRVEPLLFKKESVIVSGLSADDRVIELRAGANRLAGMRVVVEGE